MVSTIEVPLAIQQMGKQLARKDNRMCSSVDYCNSTVKVKDAASYCYTDLAPVLRFSELFQKLCTAVHWLANLENVRKKMDCQSLF